MNKNLKISAVVVTRNRQDYLRDSIGSLLDQSIGKENYEIIVVDNNSEDDTASIVKEWMSEHEHVKYVLASEPGSSRARNAGLAAASAPLIAYLDDDAIAPANWLEEMIAVFENHDPTPACVGGKILPLWDSPPPEWFPKRYLPSLSMLDRGEHTIRLDGESYIVGANMAFVRDRVIDAGGFNDNISLYSDEIYMQDMIRRRGGEIYYSPKAWVHHRVPSSRVTVDYLRQRKYRGGKGELAILHSRVEGYEADLLLWKNVIGRPLKIAYLYGALGVARLFGNRDMELESIIQISRSRGIMEQALVMLRGSDY